MSNSEPDSSPELISRLGPTGLLAILWAVAPAICGSLLLVYARTVSDWLHAQGHPADVLIFIAGFAISAGLGFLPTYAQSALAGWCFGFSLGFPAAWAGFAGASLIGYLVARTVSRHRVQDLIQTNPKARAVHDTLIGHGFLKTLGLVTLLRIPPNSPFALMNLAMSATGVPVGAYLLGTVLGMAPRTAAAVYIGSTLQTLTRESLGAAMPKWAWIASIGITLVVLAVVGIIAAKAAAKVTQAPPAGSGVPGDQPGT